MHGTGHDSGDRSSGEAGKTNLRRNKNAIRRAVQVGIYSGHEKVDSDVDVCRLRSVDGWRSCPVLSRLRLQILQHKKLRHEV